MPFNYTCEQCGKTFSKPAKPDARNRMRFCSLACRYAPRPGIPQPDGSMLIPLTKGQFATIDQSDADIVLQYRWSFDENGYAVRSRRRGEPGCHVVGMHREILQAAVGIEVDHVDGNGLNNRRRNIRLATVAHNRQNVGPQKNNTTGYRGVSQETPRSWRAAIRDTHLGTFPSPEEAARAYDAAARELYGEFAHPNFPAEDQ